MDGLSCGEGIYYFSTPEGQPLITVVSGDDEISKTHMQFQLPQALGGPLENMFNEDPGGAMEFCRGIGRRLGAALVTENILLGFIICQDPEASVRCSDAYREGVLGVAKTMYNFFELVRSRKPHDDHEEQQLKRLRKLLGEE